MYELAPRFSPSQKLVSVAWEERSWRYQNNGYVTVGAPCISTARKRSETFFYSGWIGVFTRPERLGFSEDDATLEAFMAITDGPSLSCLLSERGEFQTFASMAVEDVVPRVQSLQAALADEYHRAPGYSEWYKPAT